MRVAWLLTHKALLDFEVPLILSLGYEVFVPKITSSDNKNVSSNYFKYDASLVNMKEELEILNQCNFYAPITDEIKNLLNKHFDICFCDLLVWKCNENLFNGKTYIRIFGREHPHNYSSFPSLNNLANNVYLACAYNEIIMYESSHLAAKSVFLPLGINKSHFDNYKWMNTYKSIAFVCSYIDTNIYYSNIKREFVDNFKDFPYKIYGHNNSGDDRVILKNDADYYNELSKHSVMFYHSKEPRHLHYHPIEAIAIGIPVIYVGGILANINKGAGYSKSIEEAREKIKRILNNDEEFIEQVIEDQKVILDYFSYEYCHTYWRKMF